ncbi:MAG: hypothetical protein KF716_20110 [Anaerolineae bacterium]|nr:hypothetical protein [Anaerolineae bacterium]
MQYYEAQGIDRLDAQNMVETNPIAICGDCARFLPNHNGTLLVLLSARKVEIFVHDNVTKRVALLQTFRSVTMDGTAKAHPAISEGGIV